MQLNMFQINDPVLNAIRLQLEELDLNQLSPIEALLKLNEIKQLLN
jgi:DNA mismatch repair protein MutS